jgi:hypothetical protein
MRGAPGSACAVSWYLLPVALGCAFFCGSGLAHAQTGAPVIQSKVVPSGETRQLAFLTSLNPDCSVNAEMSVRAVKQASHGTVEIGRGVGYTSFRFPDSRYFCNRSPREGYQVTYTSNENFKGDDEFEIEFFAPAGQYTVTRYAVTVK